MLGHSGGRGAQPPRELAGGRGRLQGSEDRCAAPAEQGGHGGRAVGARRRLPQIADSARRVDDRGLPGLVGEAERVRPRERRRDQQQPAPAEGDVLAVPPVAVDLEHPAAPADFRVQVVEHAAGPSGGEQPGSMEDVRLERPADRGPPGRDGALPSMCSACWGSSRSGRTTSGTGSPSNRRWTSRATCPGGVAPTVASSSATSGSGVDGGGEMKSGTYPYEERFASTSSSPQSNPSRRSLAARTHGR